MALPLNVNRIWVSTILLALLVSLTACGGIDARKAKYLTRGQKYYQEENYEKARLEFSNVLKIDPKHVEANYELGRTFERLNKFREAGGFYLRVIDLDPKHYQAMVRLGRIYLLSRVLNEAKAIDEKALAISPKDAGAIALRGGIHAAQGEADAALDDAKLALQLEANNVDAIALMAGIDISKQDFTAAAKIVETGVRAHPEDSEMRQLLAGLYVKLQQPDRAIAVLKEIITLKPDKINNYIQLAEFYLANKQTQEAEKVAVSAVKQFSDDTSAMIYHVDVIKRSGNPQRAEEQLKKYISENHKEYALSLSLAGMYASANRESDAVTVMQKIITDDGKGKYGLLARDGLAKYYISKNNIDKAETLINEVIAENAQDNDALIMRGSLALDKRDYPTAISDLRAALRSQPNQASLLRMLAKAHFGNGENDLAKQTYQTALTAEPRDVGLYIEYTTFLQNTGDIPQAISMVDALLAFAPDNLNALATKFSLQLSKKDGKAALQVAEKIQSLAKDKSSSYYAAGLAYQLLDNPKKADAEFSKGLSIDPDSAQILAAYTRNLLAMKKTDAAIKYLHQRIEKNNKNAIAQNLLGEIYLSLKKTDLAIQAFELAQSSQPEWPVPYRNQALAYLQTNKLDDGIKAYQRGYEQTKGDPGLGYALASIYAQTNRSDEAIKQFESLLQKSPTSEVARNNLAMILVTYRKDKASLDKAGQLIAPLMQSTNPNYLDTIGWVLYKQGEVKESIPYLRKAQEKSSEVAVINYHLGMALFKSGDKPAAKPHLEAAISSPHPFMGIDEAKEALRQL